MPSELSPAGGKPRMTKTQIKKLQEEQKRAREIAEKKLAEAKKSNEWKKEQEKLAALDRLLDSDDFIV